MNRMKILVEVAFPLDRLRDRTWMGFGAWGVLGSRPEVSASEQTLAVVRHTLLVEALPIRENDPIPEPTLMTLPNPNPVVAPAFRFLTRVHLNLKSFSRLTSIPISCKILKTSSMTSLGGLDDKAD